MDYDSILTEEELSIISSEFTRLEDKTYLDYAGAALSPKTQLEHFTKDLTENLYANPHTSKYTNDCIDQVRSQILNHFNTDDSEYSVIFTSGATSSIKLVAEAFDYDPKIPDVTNLKDSTNNKKGALVYLHENHTSVLGMRDVTLSKSANIVDISRQELINNVSVDENGEFLDSFDSFERALFVYPAQCNFSGYKYPLKWIDNVKNGILNEFTNNKIGRTYYEWAILLDAAAFVSTNKLNLATFKPDFVCISFYKIFGYPTGLGALLVRNTSAFLLSNKTYYGGGTVEIALSQKNYHVKRSILHERFEDGTIPFLSILAVKHGFDALNKIIPKKLSDNFMETISLHTFNLAKYLYQRMQSMQHYNNKPVFVIYADTTYDNSEMQGGIVNFNIIQSNGEFVGYAEVVHMAELFNITLRSGCFCNPGACQRHLRLTNVDLLKHHKAGHKCGDNFDLIDGVPTGSLRVSFGYMSTVKDVNTLILMIDKCFVDKSDTAKLKIKIEHLSLQNGINQNLIDKTKTLKHHNGFDTTATNQFSQKGILKEIHIYPVKSCAAFIVRDDWEICEKGLKYDRDWMITNVLGVLLTQKQNTAMCLIKPIIDLQNNVLILTYPKTKDISIPLDLEIGQIIKSNICNSKVCGDKIQGYDCGDNVAQWLTDVLGLPGLRLLRQANTQTRLQKKKLNGVSESSMSLANEAQYLLVNIASVKWLSNKVQSGEFEDRLDNLVKRFRGNFIVETDVEFEESKWKKLKIGNKIFDVHGPCTRCQMICIDQENGEKTTEPLRTISKELQGKLRFGMYLSHESITQKQDRFLKCNSDIYITEDKEGS